MPNGVDLSLFHEILNTKLPEPENISKIHHPGVCVVGMLDWRTDVKLLLKLAQRNNDWSIILVGPVNITNQNHFDCLRSMKNVYFLGKKKVNEVPLYMKALDVGLIPYKITEHIKSILSLKLFES